MLQRNLNSPRVSAIATIASPFPGLAAQMSRQFRIILIVFALFVPCLAVKEEIREALDSARKKKEWADFFSNFLPSF
jgi:hypothetical protein